MAVKRYITTWLVVLVICLKDVFSDEEKVEERQLFGSIGIPGSLPYQDPIASSFKKTEVIQHYPFQQPQKFEFIPDTMNRLQSMGQLGQYIQQGLGQYPQVGAPPQYQPQLYQQYPPSGGTSVAQALTSIARYDDLKCVPRLLCEVAAGGKPGYFSGTRETGGIPFLNKDVIMSILTILNFGDTQPITSFGRAILLGITAKADPNTCFSAYPLCPRDPDSLVDYLNNHNGGLFKFFSNRGSYNPSRPYGRIQNGAHRITATPGRIEDNPGQGPSRGPKQLQFPNVYPPPITQNVNAFRDPDYFRKEKLSLLFPNNENVEEFPESNFFDNNESANSATNTFYFPGNINNEQSHQYYVNEESSISPVNAFNFPGNINKGQSLDSDFYNKIQSSHSPGKTFFPSNNGQLADSNLYNHRQRVKSFHFPPNENSVNNFQVQDYKKLTTPMTFPDQNENGDFRFVNSKINKQVVNSPLTNFSGSRKPNFSFGFERNQSTNLAKNSIKRDKRNKREEKEIPNNHKPNEEEYEIIQDNEEGLKYSSEGIEQLYDTED